MMRQHCVALARAIEGYADEHGVPHVVRFGELVEYGAPDPKLAGRAIRSSDWRLRAPRGLEVELVGDRLSIAPRCE